MDDSSPVEEVNLIKDFDGLEIPPPDCTFYSQHMTEMYKENVDDFPRTFKNIDFLTDDLIIDAPFNYTFPNPTDDDAFQNPSNLPNCLDLELGLGSYQMDPNSFDQPRSQLIECFDDAFGTFKSTSRDCLGEAPDSNSVQMDPNCFGKPGNQLIENLDDSSRNVKLRSEEMRNFVGNQAAGDLMYMDTSSLGLLHNWSSLGVLKEVSPSLHQVSTDVSKILNVLSVNCGSNLSKGHINLLDSNKLAHSSLNLKSNSVKGGIAEYKLDADISNSSYLLKRKKGGEDSNNASKHPKSTIFSLSDQVTNDEDEKREARLIRNRESAHLSRQRRKNYVEELENKVRIMQSTINYLSADISCLMVENATLKTQLMGTGVPPQVPPPPKMYTPPPQWVSYTPSYIMNAQGSQVLLLKPQEAAPNPKSSKKVEEKKSEVKI